MGIFVTTNEARTIRKEFNAGSGIFDQLPGIFKLMQFGDMLEPKSSTVSQTAAPTITISPAPLALISVRVTAGAAAAGARIIQDAAGTPSATIASYNAATGVLTFEANVTGAVIQYVPGSAVDIDSNSAYNYYPPSTP